jgi:hypothetical protein
MLLLAVPAPAINPFRKSGVKIQHLHEAYTVNAECVELVLIVSITRDKSNKLLISLAFLFSEIN